MAGEGGESVRGEADQETVKPKKPLQHKMVREVATEVVAPVAARMGGMEDWLTDYTKRMHETYTRQQQELNDMRQWIVEARTPLGLPLWLTDRAPWWVRAWRWLKTWPWWA